MKKRVAIFGVCAALLALGLPLAIALVRAQTGYRAAQELFAHQLWPQARQRLESYLWLHPSDARARLLMAEAFTKDEALPADEAAHEAIRWLVPIPDDSPFAAEARFKEGGFYFLLLQQPDRGEQRLRRSIELGEGPRARELLWTLLSFTGRPDDTEDLFWSVYESASEQEQPLHLRAWYLNVFSPVDAHEFLDRKMGVLARDEMPSRTAESRRYLRFREREPNSPIGHAAVALWCQQEGDPDFAVRVLETAEKQVPEVDSNPFFLSVSIATYLDLGRFDEARACFHRWPEGDRGHAYWKWQAVIFDEVLHKHEEALVAYDRALALWPGAADWHLHHRKAICLARLRRSSEAEAVKERVALLRTLMKPSALDRRKAALRTLADPDQLTEVAEFYRHLGRNREADCWQKYIDRLRGLVAKTP